MTITSTNYGANTVNINISGEYDVNNIITAIDVALTGHGWSQFDLITPTNATYAYQRIYRSTNVDGTFKFMQLFFYPWEHRIYVDFFESWNATTHVGTNQCYMGPMDIGARIDYAPTYCNILVMANSHWCVLMSSITTTPQQDWGPWVGCFEVTRDAPEDTTGVGIPCWFATTSLKLANGGTPNTNGFNLETGIQGTAQYSVSFPRTTIGTGYLASIHSGVASPYFSSGSPGSNNSMGAILGNVLGSASRYFTNSGPYAWNKTYKVATPFRPLVNSELHGTVIGAKLMNYQFSNQAKVTIPLDANYFYSAVGTSTDHWVLPLQVQTYRQFIAGNLKQQNAPYATGILSGVTFFRKIFLAPNGWYYVCTQSSISKINPISYVSMAVAGLPANPIDACFDGRYIYTVANSANGNLYTIDTLNGDAVTTNVAVGSTLTPWGICCDDTNIWVGCRNSTGPAGAVVQISKASPNAVAFTAALSTSSSVSYIMSIIVDNDGNCFAIGSFNSLGGASPVANYVWKVSPGGTSSSISAGYWPGLTTLMMVSPRRILTCGWSNNNTTSYIAAQTITTDTFTQSTNITMNNNSSYYFNNSGSIGLYSMTVGSPPKISLYGNTLLINGSGTTGITGIYVNTAVTSNVILGTSGGNYNYMNTTSMNWTGYGELKYNQWFGTSGGSLILVSNLYRADDIYSNPAGRMILPY